MQREHQDSEYTRGEITRHVGVGRKKESNSEERRRNTMHICVHETFFFGRRQIRPCGNRETFGPENERTARIRLCSTEARSTVSGNPKLQYDSENKNTLTKSVFVDSDFAGDPVSSKSTAGLVAQVGNHTVKSGSTLQNLTALSVGEAEFYAVVN